jgi:hypothetical protein
VADHTPTTDGSMNPAPRPSLGGLDTQRPITEARIIHHELAGADQAVEIV